MLSYRYQSLQYNNSIRILVLHPSLIISDPITCTIQHAQLSDVSLEYEAVSYTWGDATQTQAIYFRNSARELHVRHNCYNALRHLRRQHGDRLLWIDAICINQNDLRERARQVRLMDEIYNLASNVLVILREPNANNGILFEELAAADEAISRIGHCDREPPSDDILRLLEAFFRDPWFKRVWVLQEVCAKSSVEFICGSASFSYTSLLELYHGYGNTVVTREYWPLALQWIGMPPDRFSTPQFNLWNRLGESREYLATDPKDRVFALKSLIGSRQSEMDPLIDYAQSLEECYTRVATFLLPVLGLQLLTAVRHPHDKKMPSWIPDWSQRLPLNDVYFMVEFPRAESGQLVPRSGACDKQKHALRSFLSKRDEICLELHVTGCRYAQIVDSSQTFQFVNTDDAEKQMKRLYYNFINLRQYVNPEGMWDDPTVIVQLGRTISHVMASMDGLQLHVHLTRSLATVGTSDGYLTIFESIQYFLQSLQQCKISLMENGELVIVPEAVQSGDVIYILSGAISACALRPSPDGRWALVSGDCHIFTDNFRNQEEGFFMCDEYIACNQDKVEEFRLW